MKNLLVVIGTGLIGSSFAKGARSRGLFRRIVGIEPNAERAAQALALGIVDEVVDAAPEEADAVLIAGPSDTIADWVVTLGEHRGILFDVGSVKSDILDSVRERLGEMPRRYVPCHPIAGSERRGPDAADENLFRGQKVVITPHPSTEAIALTSVAAWWQNLGAHTEHMDALHHDRVLAISSHLPHLLAFAYLQQIENEHLDLAGGGFRDFTRIGASDSEMWGAVFQLNKNLLLEALTNLEVALDRFREAINRGDEETIQQMILAAQQRRQNL